MPLDLGDKSHYGYKNHVNVDREHKLVRRYQVTDAAVHDSQVVDDILDNSARDPREPRDLPSSTSVASFFQVP